MMWGREKKGDKEKSRVGTGKVKRKVSIRRGERVGTEGAWKSREEG